MKRGKIGLIVVLVLAAALALTATGWAQATKTEFEGQAYPIGAPSDLGECRVAGGMEICRGLTVPFLVDVGDSPFSGDGPVVINSSFKIETNSGRQWGTFQHANDGGWWDATWNGYKTAGEGFTYLRGVAHGHGGYEGLKVHFTLVREDPNMMVPMEVEGYILDPHGD